MPTIHLETFINAPVDIVFDLSRSVDLHQASMQHHHEKAIAGVTSGLMKKGDTVTWQAKHLFQIRKLMVTITEMTPPTFFADEMIKGDFRKMRHEHFFKPLDDGTRMTDRFYFESPFGFFGKLVNVIFLKRYMTRLLLQRNNVIKQTAENHL